MRSTRGKTRATRARAIQHYTDGPHRVTVKAESTERAEYGSRELPAGVNTGYGSRIGWNSDMNTNTNLARGGISSYYRSRERGYSLSMEER